MFDTSTTVLIERALGMNKIDYLKAYAFAGHPLVETRARFKFPTRYGDEVAIESPVDRMRPFELQDRAPPDQRRRTRGRGFETRVWVVRPAGDPRA